MTGLGRRKPTLDDVASRAGVSRATASRVLNGGVRRTDSIKEDVRQAIFAAARDLDYMPNRQAQAMAAGAQRTVAILITEIDDPGSSALVAGASRAARASDYSLTVGLAGLTEEDEIDALRAIRGQRPSALIVAVSRTVDAGHERRFGEELRAYAADGGRVSIIGENSFAFDQVVLDNAGSAGLLAQALYDRGYRRFAIVTGSPDQVTPENRSRGFSTRLADLGVVVDPHDVIVTDFDRDGGYAAAGELIERLADLDMIFATSDAVALGVVSRLRDEGFSIPGDIAVAGFDDVAIVRDLTPPLTTVHVDLEALAGISMTQLIEPGEPGSAPRTSEVVGEVVIRSSTPRRA